MFNKEPPTTPTYKQIANGKDSKRKLKWRKLAKRIAAKHAIEFNALNSVLLLLLYASSSFSTQKKKKTKKILLWVVFSFIAPKSFRHIDLVANKSVTGRLDFLTIRSFVSLFFLLLFYCSNCMIVKFPFPKSYIKYLILKLCCRNVMKCKCLCVPNNFIDFCIFFSVPPGDLKIWGTVAMNGGKFKSEYISSTSKSFWRRLMAHKAFIRSYSQKMGAKSVAGTVQKKIPHTIEITSHLSSA